MTPQERMEKIIDNVINYTKSDNGSGIIKMMNPSFLRCSHENLQLEIKYRIESWELNPQKSMHGGLLCAAFDNTFGMRTHYFADNNFITKVDIATRFLKPITEGDDLIIRAKINSHGRTLVSMTGEAVIENKNLVAATSSATFMILRGKETQINSLHNIK